MEISKQQTKQHVFSEEQLELLKKSLKVQTIRKDIIGLLDSSSCRSCSQYAQKEIFSDFISEWHKELQRSVKNTEKMIVDGHA